MVELTALAGPAVAVLFGGVLGAGVGTMVLYAGAIESGEAEDIFKDDAEVSKIDIQEAKAHSVQEAKFEARRVLGRGFAAMFA